MLLTRVGLSLPDQLSFEAWERAGHRLSGIVDSSSWCLGDWLVYGREHYSDRYKMAIRTAGLQYQTLRNYAWVSQRFDLDRRRSRLTFQHHAEVASLSQPDQDMWLDQAEQNMWTTKQLRTHLRAERIDSVGEADHQPVLSRIEVPEAQVTRWRKAADQVGMDLTGWVTAALDAAAEQALGQEPARPGQPVG